MGVNEKTLSMLNLETQQLNERSLKANFTEVQQRYFDKLMSELEVISGGLGFAELKKKAEAGRSEALQVMRDYITKKEQVVVFLETKKIGIDKISATTPEGKEVSFELREMAQYWNKFYQDEGIDWAEPIPEDISIAQEQETEMKRLITEFGFDKMMIVPDGLVGEPEFEEYEEDGETKVRLVKPDQKYIDLHAKMSEGYVETYQAGNYKEDGGIGATKDKRKGLRIILTKQVQELKDDELFKQTLDKSIEDLEKEDGIFAEKGVTGLTESEYLVLQREYFKETKKHLDEKNYTWLSASSRPVSARTPNILWHPEDQYLCVYSDGHSHRFDFLGCRLVGSFEIVT